MWCSFAGNWKCRYDAAAHKFIAILVLDFVKRKLFLSLGSSRTSICILVKFFAKFREQSRFLNFIDFLHRRIFKCHSGKSGGRKWFFQILISCFSFNGQYKLRKTPKIKKKYFLWKITGIFVLGRGLATAGLEAKNAIFWQKKNNNKNFQLFFEEEKKKSVRW